MGTVMKVRVDISVGELFDKLTILEIKAERIEDEGKLKNVRKELDRVSAIATHLLQGDHILDLVIRLKELNERLWDVEDKIRLCERDQQFDKEFIELARSVYITNDLRAYIKAEINKLLGSDLVEEKSYQEYK